MNDKHNQSTFLSAPVQVAGYMCMVVNGGPPRHIHKDLKYAVKEAERLASMQSGRSVQVLAVIGTVTNVPTLEWK